MGGMMGTRSLGYALRIGAATVLLAGCTAPTLPFITTGRAYRAPASIDGDSSWKNLYVLNGAGGRGYQGTITVYRPGGKTPFRTVYKGLGAPQSMAFDRAGNLYVGNVGTVTVYRRGTGTLIRTIVIPESDIVFALAFDHDGYLYVDVFSTGRGFVAIYFPNSTRRFAVIRDDVDIPTDITFNHAGNLFVSNSYNLGNDHGWISVYAPRTTRPLRAGRRRPRSRGSWGRPGGGARS